jgi:hypothetical protein
MELASLRMLSAVPDRHVVSDDDIVLVAGGSPVLYSADPTFAGSIELGGAAAAALKSAARHRIDDRALAFILRSRPLNGRRSERFLVGGLGLFRYRANVSRAALLGGGICVVGSHGRTPLK